MVGTNKEKIEKVRRRTIPIYDFSMSLAVLVVGIIAYLAAPLSWIPAYVAIFCVINTAWGVINIIQKYAIDENFMPYYYTFMYVYLFPAVLLLWQNHVYAVILLYLFLPTIQISRHYTSKHLFYAYLASAIIIVAIIIISYCVQFLDPDDVQSEYENIVNIAIIIAAALLLSLFFYCYHTMLQIIQDENSLSAKAEEKAKSIESSKLKELYNSLIVYFDTKQSYCQPNYTLAMLAADLNTNTKYLSEAINMYSGGTFDSLLNKYRLEFVKKMLDERLADKYTIEYIYTLAGYSSRSTFYKNFYKTFQTTPLEYQKILKS
jgi:AraC-like DNA-binding protein